MFNLGFERLVVFAAIVWFGCRLLLAVIDVVRLCRQVPRLSVLRVILPPFLSGFMGGAGAIAARMAFLPDWGPAEPFNVLAGFIGIVAGVFIDFFLFINARRVAAKLLARRLPALAWRLQEGDAAARLDAARKLYYIGPSNAAATPQLLEALRDPEADVRRQAALALLAGQAEAADLLPGVTRALRDPDPGVRTVAAATLVRLKSAAAAAVLPDLIAGLKDPDEAIRFSAAHYLGELGPEAAPAVPALGQALCDPTCYNPTVYDVLSKIGAAGVPALVEGLQHGNATVRGTAAFTLGNMEAKASAAVPALREALADSEWSVRFHVAKALKRIDRVSH